MSETLRLSYKELGYFASRLLAAGRCMPGVAPQIAQVLVAHDLLYKNALEKLTEVVVDYPDVLEQLEIDVQSIESDLYNFEYRMKDVNLPVFAVGPRIVDHLISEAPRRGVSRTKLNFARTEHCWFDSVLVTRRALNIALVVITRANPGYFSICVNGELYKGSSLDDSLAANKSRLEKPTIVRQMIKEVNNLTPEEVSIWAIDESDEILAWAQRHLSIQSSLSKCRSEIYRSGRLMTKSAWERMRTLVSSTLIPTSAKSRIGAQ